MTTILIVEDEPSISQVLKVYLRREGYLIKQAFTSEEATNFFYEINPTLVILDVMLPGTKDGWSILQEIREHQLCPVIMLTALDHIDNRLYGFKYGADDYITKPFVAEEVVARVKAVLKRSQSTWEIGEVREFGSLRINEESREVKVKGEIIDLTPRDFSLLMFLSAHPNQFFSRDHLLDALWGVDYEGSDRAVDLSIKRIRQALKEWSQDEGEIRTQRGLGYQLYVKRN